MELILFPCEFLYAYLFATIVAPFIQQSTGPEVLLSCGRGDLQETERNKPEGSIKFRKEKSASSCGIFSGEVLNSKPVNNYGFRV